MTEPVKIRAHHLLCLQGYQGYGYNREFERNLQEIVDFFQEIPDQKVEVVAENDIVCAKCPNGKDGFCQNDIEDKMRIKSMDLMVLERLKMKPGVVEKMENLLILANQVLRRKGDATEICGQCQWREKCLWFIKRDPL